MARRRSIFTALGVAAVTTVGLPLTAAGAAGGAISNGNFESDPVGSSSVSGWSFENDLVDLGVTELGGCVTQDTSSYGALRDYDDNAEIRVVPPVPVGAGDELLAPGTTDEVWLDTATGADAAPGDIGALQIFYGTFTDRWGDTYTDFYVVEESDKFGIWDYADQTGNYDFAETFTADVLPAYGEIPDPTVRADDVPGAGDASFWDDVPEFASVTVDADTAYDSSIEPSSTALELRSDLDSSDSGYIAHGPAAVSDAFTTTSARTVLLDWAASGDEDDYHVLGYVLDVDSCTQIEVLDSTGESSPWQTASVDLPSAGTYRFVFVAGTYDATWGGVAGAILYVDNIRAVPVSTGGTSLDLEPLFGVGDPVAGAPIQLTGGGLMPNSPWTAELHSTPVTLATGMTDASGNFWMLANLPSSVDPGQHEIVLTGTAPDGTPRVDVVWITVAPGGTIGYLSLITADGAGGSGSGGGGPVGSGGSSSGGAGGVTTSGGGATPVAGSTSAANQAAAGSSLAMTGFDPVPWVTFGSAFVVAGGLLTLTMRRRVRRG